MRSKSNRKRIVLATSNPGKLQEIRRYLGRLPVEFLSLQDIGADEDVEEKGETFLENARLKSLAYSSLSEYPTLAEDSGLTVEYLDGAPGVFSARFSYPGATDDRNIQKVLRLLERVPWRDRRARFVCQFVLSQKGRLLKEYRGQVRGTIALEKSGDFGFGYDPIFFYGPFGRTFGQLRPERKNTVSHRGRALKKIRLYLLRLIASPEREA
ncbi:MAG: RdgB/HAM1 family non-canonical purine NTP pyrophosphatase [Proteobacteria bacterium]|nr:RdgB/HAM1 family non-canonical purine NTP pyrophosphatase [Pseudomonadota bacterium]